ncbi:DNA polymerase III subunit gamma/tau [Variovorax sp. PCZ-1]|uniref:DNA polymerase III subunit gamma/tau n=1 Tax=Variovorax sp. PCZ-1 TaxID=2835533 RepID=UPI001BCE636C|nr:DNA polymerase III subunit gamma/tau [Variovorax sp. PCZ-1]MBS7807361.1 DNA polymerase III subunit gamma/tau [Variovorax sp. PCZ-1]
MSYLVLARKYRPKSFTEMVGQEHVVKALSNALTQQRLHHAYLFTGTRGVGKTTVSRILAKSLNCVGTDGSGGITAEPCGVCEMCRAIDAGRFVDYTELDAASNRGVDEVQSLLEQAVYKPVQGRFKVFMIDEVHMLTNTAFNAMLKTLEEPPEYLKFVLATTDPQKVPVTVLSRCLQFSLRPMAPETVHTHLKKVLAEESVQAEDGALRLIARGARGSMRDALSLTDQAIAFGAGSLNEANVRQMLGAVDRSYVFRLIEALAVGDGKAVFDIANALRDNGLSAASTLEDMAVVLQRMAVCQQVPNSHDVQDSEAVEISRLATLMPADETQLLYSIAIHGRGELGLAPDEYTGLTMSLLRLLAFKPKGFRPANIGSGSGGGAVGSAAIAEAEKKSLKTEAAAHQEPAHAPASIPAPVHAAPEPHADEVAASSVSSLNLEQKQHIAGIESAQSATDLIVNAAPTPEPIPSPIPVPAPAAAPASLPTSTLMAVPIREQGVGSGRLDSRIAAVEPDAHHEAWVQLVQQLLDAQAVQGMVQQLAVQSQCVEKGASHLTLRVAQPSLKSDNARDELQSAMQSVGRAEALVIEVGPVQDSWAKRNTAKLEARQKQAEQIITQDPWVQDLMAQWGAKIVPGSIKAV